jgi:hypothetical protein
MIKEEAPTAMQLDLCLGRILGGGHKKWLSNSPWFIYLVICFSSSQIFSPWSNQPSISVRTAYSNWHGAIESPQKINSWCYQFVIPLPHPALLNFSLLTTTNPAPFRWSYFFYVIQKKKKKRANRKNDCFQVPFYNFLNYIKTSRLPCVQYCCQEDHLLLL